MFYLFFVCLLYNVYIYKTYTFVYVLYMFLYTHRTSDFYNCDIITSLMHTLHACSHVPRTSLIICAPPWSYVHLSDHMCTSLIICAPLWSYVHLSDHMCTSTLRRPHSSSISCRMSENGCCTCADTINEVLPRHFGYWSHDLLKSEQGTCLVAAAPSGLSIVGDSCCSVQDTLVTRVYSAVRVVCMVINTSMYYAW